MTIAVNRNLSNSVFHSFNGLMNSINWPASSIWVFIAQLGEHCSANAEAMGSNPFEAPKSFFSGFFAITQIAIHCDGHILISFVFPQFTSFHSVIGLFLTDIHQTVCWVRLLLFLSFKDLGPFQTPIFS